MYYGFKDMLSNMMILWSIPIVILLIIGVSIYMIRQNNKRKDINSSSALNILNKKFAKGEIDEEEYERKKKNLKNF